MTKTLHDAYIEEVSKLSALKERLTVPRDGVVEMLLESLRMTTSMALEEAKSLLASHDAVSMVRRYEVLKAVREGNEQMLKEFEGLEE